MRVTVVGCGSIGRRHIGNLLALGCEVHAMDISESARAQTKALFPTAQVSDVARMDVDALVICTPWDRHLEWVEDAIRRRLPFFVEKPLGSLEQLSRWREIAAMDLPVNQVGYQCRFHRAIQEMRSFVEPPTTGGGFYCDCDSRTWPGGSYGPPLLECSHELDLALWCGAPPYVDSVLFHDARNGNVWLGPDERWLVSVHDRSDTYCRHWELRNSARDVSARWRAPEHLGEEMYRDELAHFLECVKTNTPTICPLADGLKVLEVCAQVEAMTRQVA